MSPRRHRSPALPARPAAVFALDIACLATLLATRCASTRPTRPVPPGEISWAASLGGPLVAALDTVLPTPILNAGAAFGVRDRLAVFGNADVTSLLFGTLHLEPGLVWHPPLPSGGAVPSPALAASCHFLTDFAEVRVAPQLTALASWSAGAHLLYLGADAALAVGSPTRIIAGPLIGGQLRRGRLGLGLELKWLAPYHDVEPLAPSWISPGHRGYLAVLVGVTVSPERAP